MGRLKHFSHPHELELANLPNPITNICSACKLPESGEMYICRPCNFTLHLSCTQFPELISHPCHPDHPLTLLPSSSYPGGLFNCDACNHRGDGFNYHCLHCEFDLHLFCASKPLKITHQMHDCPLHLTFDNPYDDVKGFSCDVCRKIGSKQWLYRCSSCEFDVHLHCSTASSAPKQLPFPGFTSHTPQIHQSFIGSTSHAQFQQLGPLIRPNQLHIPPVTESQAGGYMSPNQHPQQPAIGSSLLNAAIQGLVEGAAQQVGQSIVGSILGHGTDDSGNA